MKREEWYKLLDPNLAYTAKEIALLMGVNIITARRHIQRAVAYGLLEERRKGRVKFYALAVIGQSKSGNGSAEYNERTTCSPADASEKVSTCQKPAQPENVREVYV